MRKNRDKLGQELVTQCHTSVLYRYGYSDDDSLPGPINRYYLKPYRWTDLRYQPTATELLKALDCYSYQSCEHPGWTESAVRRLVLRIGKKLVWPQPMKPDRIQEEEEKTPWGFEFSHIPICYAKSHPIGASLVAAIEAGETSAEYALFDWLIEQRRIDRPVTFQNRHNGLNIIENLEEVSEDGISANLRTLLRNKKRKAKWACAAND